MEGEFNCEYCCDTGIEFESCCSSASEAANSLCGCQGEADEVGPCLHCQDEKDV